MTSTSVDFKYIGLTDYASVLYNITQHDPKQLFIESIHYDNIFVNLSSRLGTNKLSVNDGGGVIDLSLRTTFDEGRTQRFQRQADSFGASQLRDLRFLAAT